MHISITGLKPKNFFATFRFWFLAIPSFNQAKSAPGNLFCEVKKINGFQCTLTAWESRELMLEYLRSGTHLKALKAFKDIATGKSFGYASNDIPTWEVAFQRLMEEGKNH